MSKRIGLKLSAFALSVLGSLSLAHAEDQLELGLPAYGGTGCPAGTVSAALSPDNQSLSILFDSFVVESGGETGRFVDRKNCNVAVPVHVPQGYSVSVFQVDYRGYNLVPSGGRSVLGAEYFFADARGPRISKSFYGPQNQDYFYRNELVAEALVWTACGEDTNLRMNVSMMTQSNRSNDQAMSTVDSSDISTGVIYHIRWKRCE
jgi:hypothetical protein